MTWYWFDGFEVPCGHYLAEEISEATAGALRRFFGGAD